MPLSTAIRGEYFDQKALAAITGVSQFPSNLVMMVGPLFAGILFDIQGTYFTAFVTFAAISFLGGVLIMFVKKPGVTRKEILGA